MPVGVSRRSLSEMPTCRRSWLTLALVLCAAVALVGCGQAGAPPRSGVAGHFWVCATTGRWLPAAEHVEIFGARHHHALVGLTVTQNWGYSLYVPPGRYTIVFSYLPITTETSRWPGLPVTVNAHKMTLVNDALGSVVPHRDCRSHPPGPPVSYPPGPYGTYIPLYFTRPPPRGTGKAMGLIAGVGLHAAAPS